MTVSISKITAQGGNGGGGGGIFDGLGNLGNFGLGDLGLGNLGMGDIQRDNTFGSGLGGGNNGGGGGLG